MNAADRTQSQSRLSSAQMNRAAEIRELIHAQMYFVRVYAAVVEDFAEAGDDAGLSYTLEKLALYTKTALSLRFDIDAIKRETTKPSETA